MCLFIQYLLDAYKCQAVCKVMDIWKLFLKIKDNTLKM